jgi:signal transduction histidine kinase
VTLVERFADQAALAIDNARWFARIRNVTADEERVRIARDLHDRIGQSLALVGFELDRVHRTAHGTPMAEDIASVRANVRQVVSDVRETLYDLRTEISEREGLVETLANFLDRVSARTGLQTHFDHIGARPLPMRQEREMWRIAQEAIVNVERHAEATRLDIVLRSDGTRAALEVRDNGRGFTPGSGRADSFGMLGLRERASAIGARLDIESHPGQGTVIRCRLNP